MTPLSETGERPPRLDSQLVKPRDKLGREFFRQSQHR
jgi:hypothetical protein